MSNRNVVQLRAAVVADVDAIHEMIGELADYERLRHQFVGTKDQLRDHLFGEARFASVILAELQGVPVGFALYFYSYSTFLCRPGIYLEDLYVKASHRRQGIGLMLLRRLAAQCVAQGCGRLEWAVLDWNEPSIAFYRQLGAKPMDDWTTYRLTDEALTRLAEG